MNRRRRRAASKETGGSRADRAAKRNERLRGSSDLGASQSEGNM
ncbi:hypothetical protein [Paenibacillus sp. CECT 9249]|nr:hypothetical protein [Paenibacillus sp. CECT 9249]